MGEMMGRKKQGELAPLQVANLTKPGLYFVGGVAGLALQVTASGARSWILRKMIAGKRRDMGLGSYPTVTLAMARDFARDKIKLIAEGQDPIDERRAARMALAAARLRRKTFAQCVDDFLDSFEAEWKNPKHRQQWFNTLDTYANPIIGEMDVASIEKADVLAVLEPIWKTKTETASRVRGRIERVLSWATERGFRHGLNPARWKDNLENLLAKPKKISKPGHHAALPYRGIGQFMVDLREQAGMAALALEFTILTAARTTETLLATWAEFDLVEKVWTVPAGRMKAGREHRVPLPDAAVDLLESLPRESDLVFPGMKGKPLSNMAMSAVLKRMGRDGITVHGFRSTFRDWAAEKTAYPSEVVEMALAHAIGDKTEAAYRRGDLFEKRRRLMADWAIAANTITVTGELLTMPIRGSRADKFIGDADDVEWSAVKPKGKK